MYRPLVAVGRQEVGFLPGDLDDKLAPWMAAVYDNLYAMFSGADPLSAKRAVDELLDRDVLEMAAVTYLRGRLITDEVVIIDEAQNLELPTLKVILTRMAADSKLILCGDLTQVDNPYVSPFGGLAALIEKLKGSPLFGHVTLDRTVRGPLAEFAAAVLRTSPVRVRGHDVDGSTPPTLRLLVVDPRAFASFDRETLHRVADRIGGQRPRLVFAGVGARPEPELPIPIT